MQHGNPHYFTLLNLNYPKEKRANVSARVGVSFTWRLALSRRTWCEKARLHEWLFFDLELRVPDYFPQVVVRV